jgi:hypothetical protein
MDTNNNVYDACEECKTFREKQWKLCAKCGNPIEYPNAIRSKLNEEIGDVAFDQILIIDVSNMKLGYPYDKVINIDDMINIGKISHIDFKSKRLQFKYQSNSVDEFLYQKYLLKFFNHIGINCVYINTLYESDVLLDPVINANYIIHHVGHLNSNMHAELVEKDLKHTRPSVEYLIKKLVKNRITDPLCINFNSNMIYVQELSEKTRRFIINEINDGDEKYRKYYTRDNFRFLDSITCTLYYSHAKDVLYTYDELKEYFDVEFKIFDIKINEYSDLFMLRNIRIRILNEKFERLYHFADIRNKITKYIVQDFHMKTGNDENNVMMLMCLLGMDYKLMLILFIFK